MFDFVRKSEKYGSVEFPKEGYLVKWSPTGLQIEVTDYHAGTLKLSWKRIVELSEKALPKKSVQKTRLKDGL